LQGWLHCLRCRDKEASKQRAKEKANDGEAEDEREGGAKVRDIDRDNSAGKKGKGKREGKA
jgi:hypothetical protein